MNPYTTLPYLSLCLSLLINSNNLIVLEQFIGSFPLKYLNYNAHTNNNNLFVLSVHLHILYNLNPKCLFPHPCNNNSILNIIQISYFQF